MHLWLGLGSQLFGWLGAFLAATTLVLIPLVYTVSITTGLPLVYVGLPLASALSVTHGFTPPLALAVPIKPGVVTPAPTRPLLEPRKSTAVWSAH